MRRRFLMAVLVGTISAISLSACGSTDASKVTRVESTSVAGGSVSLDASEKTQPVSRLADTKSSQAETTAASTEAASDITATSVPAKTDTETPETVRFVIIQDSQDKMLTLTNKEDQTLTVDAQAAGGYTGDIDVKDGKYEAGGSSYYIIPYSDALTVSGMNSDAITYVSAEYLDMASVAVQNASSFVINSDRSVIINGKDDGSKYSYRVWMPSRGVTEETKTEIIGGTGTGTIKLYWDGTKIAMQQLSRSEPSVAEEPTTAKGEDSEVATVDWRTACPWADKIATGVWSDGADLSNVKQLQEGIMSAKFTPVDEIKEDAKVVNLTFYDADKKKLGVLKFWQKGNHVEIDGKKFDYDTFGLE